MFEKLFQYVDEIVIKNISNMVGIFATTITPLIGACITLYFLYLAYSFMIDAQKVPALEAIKTLMSLSLTTFVAFNTEWYLKNIVPAILYAGDDIANALLGTTTASGGSSLQRIFDVMMNQIGDLWASVDMSITDGESIQHGIMVIFLIILTGIGFIAFLVISLTYLLVAKIMVSFLLIMGSAFIIMSFFPVTREYFKAWTGQCTNYILLSIMYPVAFTVFLQLMEKLMFAENISMGMVMMTTIILLALVMIAAQIPTLSSALSGGIGINGLVGGIGATINSAMGTMGAIGKGGAAAYKIGKESKEKAKEAGKDNIKAG